MNDPRGTDSHPTVIAVIVTFNRPEMLATALAALAAQTVRPAGVIVVDNGRQHDNREAIAACPLPVTHLVPGSNIGPAAAYAAGMRLAMNQGCDWIWAFNDDDWPRPDALSRYLSVCRSLRSHTPGIVGAWIHIPGQGQRGRGTRWRGREIIDQDVLHAEAPYRADLTTFTGCLVAADMVAKIGYPNAGYFMQMWEIEYCLRARAGGFQLWVTPEVLIECLAAGSSPGSVPPWRGYYQTRNHLLMALSHRSPTECAWWVFKNLRAVVTTILHMDQRRTRLALRLLGAWHALTGVQGKRVDPVLTAGPRPTSTRSIPRWR